MVDVSTFKTISELSIARFILIVSVIVEVVGGSTHDYNKATCVLNPGRNPQISEEHEKSQVEPFSFPDQVSILWYESIGLNLVQRDDAEIGSKPSNRESYGKNVVDVWYEHDCLIGNNEVS